MRKILSKGSVRTVPCRLNRLLAGSVFWQKPPPIPITKTSLTNCKPFMGYSSTSNPSNGFKNQTLQKKKYFLPYVFFQAVILHVQTLETSRNLCFVRKELIWTQEKLIRFQSVTQRSLICITTGSLWRNIYTKSVMKVVIKIILF